MNRKCTYNSRDGHKWNSYAEFPHTFGLTRKHGNASNEDGQIYTSPKTYTFEPDFKWLMPKPEHSFHLSSCELYPWTPDSKISSKNVSSTKYKTR